MWPQPIVEDDKKLSAVVSIQYWIQHSNPIVLYTHDPGNLQKHQNQSNKKMKVGGKKASSALSRGDGLCFHQGKWFPSAWGLVSSAECLPWPGNMPGYISQWTKDKVSASSVESPLSIILVWIESWLIATWFLGQFLCSESTELEKQATLSFHNPSSNCFKITYSARNQRT